MVTVGIVFIKDLLFQQQLSIINAKRLNFRQATSTLLYMNTLTYVTPFV